MSIDGTSNDNADGLSNTLFTALTAGVDFSLPVVDLSGVNYQLPDPLNNPLYTDVSTLTEADLTSRTVNGTGLFDGLMEAIAAHLKQEYEKGRLTGQEYSTAWVQMTTAAMGNAVQYLLNKDQSYYAAQLVQKQAQAAEIAAIQARVQLETAKVELVAMRADMETRKAQYALTKMQLANEDIKYSLGQAQVVQVEYQNANLLPAQLSQLVGQTSLITSQKDQVLYQTANILPNQKLELDKDIAIKAYQLSDQLPATVANTTEDTRGKAYNVDFLLPAQLDSIKEQTEAHRAKTLDTRMDNVTPVAGAIGKQKELHQQQITSYQRDSEQKVAKMLLDSWITQKSMDEGLSPPASLTDVNINTVMGKIRTNLNLV